MDITSALASTTLIATAQPTSTNVSGSVTIGEYGVNTQITGVNVGYTLKAVLATTGDALVLDTVDNDTAASTAWVAGNAQVETATAVGTITTSGNAAITVTAAGMTGSPKAISVAVLATDTAALWAAKVRTALAADVDVTALFTVGGATNTITLTKLASTNSVFPANDATLNIAMADGTCVGITAAPASTNTTAGVATTGADIYDGDGLDFEGIAISPISIVQGFRVRCVSGEVDLTSTGETATLTTGEIRTYLNDSGISSLLGVLTFTSTGESEVRVTVLGTAV